MPCYLIDVSEFVLLDRRVERRPHNVLDRRTYIVILKILHCLDDRRKDSRAELDIQKRIGIHDERADHGVDIVNRPRPGENKAARVSLARGSANRGIGGSNPNKVWEVDDVIKVKNIIVTDNITASEEQSEKAH